MLRGPRFSERSKGIKAVPAASRIAKEEGVDLSLVKGSGPNGVILVKDIENFKISQGAIQTIKKKEKVRASSLALRLAEKKGILPGAIKGTGTRGRVMMDDVIKAIEKPALPANERSVSGESLPMSQMRKVIAKRMSQSAFTAPHVHFFTDVELDPLNQLREEMLRDFEKQFNVRISINDFFIKTVALTIYEFPMLNAMVKGEEIYVMPEINIGLAVALEDGLIVPAIPQADRLGLGEIAQMRAELVDRARAGKLKLEEIERGTFTISSLAQFDITFFTAILNPPQSGILSIGKTCNHLDLKDGQLVANKIAHFGLSVDHRIIDGAVAAAFLESLKNRLENPTNTFKQL